jgi:hypothetical protein
MQRFAVQRWSLVLLLVIAVMAGFTVRAIAFQPEWPIDRTPDTAQRETAQDFYDALNATLGGAPTDELEALLSPVFLDHTSDSGMTRSASAFLDDMRAMGSASFPVRLEVRSIESSGTAVVVGVQLTSAGPIDVAGMTVEQASPAPHIEVLRMERGAIVDRWAPSFSWLDVSTFEGKPPAISSSVGIATSLVRVELAGSSEQSWESLGIGAVLVESGAVSLHVIDRYGTSSTQTWETGEFAAMPSGAKARLRSVDGKPASVMVYLVTHVGAAELPLPVKWEDDAAKINARTVLWSGNLLWPNTDIAHHPARVVLPPRGTVTITRPEGTALLVGATDTTKISVPGGSISMLGADRWPHTVEGLQEIDAAHAASIEGDGTVTLSNPTDTPVTVMLISIERESAVAPCPPPCQPPAAEAHR